MEDAKPVNKPRCFRNFYIRAFEKNNRQPIQKVRNAWLNIFDKYHKSGIEWAKKDGVIFEELDKPAPIAEAPAEAAAEAPKQKAPKQKAPKQKAKAVEKKAEQPPSPTTV